MKINIKRYEFFYGKRRYDYAFHIKDFYYLEYEGEYIYCS